MLQTEAVDLSEVYILYHVLIFGTTGHLTNLNKFTSFSIWPEVGTKIRQN